GHPSVENGHSPDENQVSSTSGSCVSRPEWHVSQSRGVSRETVTCPYSQYHAGIWCPHQSCRETHQSWMLRIQRKNSAFHCSGTNRIRPAYTASITGAASGPVFTHHCLLSTHPP